MARIIPNENTWVGFVPTIVDKNAPSVAELGTAVNLTPLLISINASTQGNTVPTPSIDTLFETSIAGTVQASFSADFYRDSVTAKDLAWTTLPRKTTGYVVISRFGSNGAAPAATAKVEVWPILVVSRTMANASNNTVMTFTMTAAVPEEPAEAATVTA